MEHSGVCAQDGAGSREGGKEIEKAGEQGERKKTKQGTVHHALLKKITRTAFCSCPK